MSFGLFNATTSFKIYINKIHTEKLDIFVIINWKNILINTENLGQPYVDVIWWILKQLQKHDLYVNLKKCQFYENEVQFLGFVV